jgi:hypothetical protein
MAKIGLHSVKSLGAGVGVQSSPFFVKFYERSISSINEGIGLYAGKK